MLQFYLRPDPTLIESGNGHKILVYASPSTKDGACLEFYDLEARRTFARVPDAEALIDCYTLSSPTQHNTRIVYLKGETVIDRIVDFWRHIDDTIDGQVVDLTHEEPSFDEFALVVQRQAHLQLWAGRYDPDKHGKFAVYLHDKCNDSPNDSESEGLDQQDTGRRSSFFSFMCPGFWSITFQLVGS